MRYKALSPSGRRPPAAGRAGGPSTPAAAPHRLRDWISLAVMLLLLPSLIIPALATKASVPTIAADPSQAPPGAIVTVRGEGFTPKVRGYLALDRASSGPPIRVGRHGTFTAQLEVPAEAAAGAHTVDAMIRDARFGSGGGKGLAGFAVAATLTLMVVATDTTLPSAPVSEGATATLLATTAATPWATAATTSSPATSPTAGPTALPPTPQPTPTGDIQPRLPVRAAFYYPWFPEAWDQQGMDPFTRYLPSLGYYDGGNAATIRAHIAAMQYGNVEVGIASWWGVGTRTDGRIGALLDVAASSGFRWAVYHEGEGQRDPSATEIRADLVYLRDRYASEAGHFRIGGRFVVFVYADGGDGCDMVDRWKAANADVGAYVVLKVFSGYRSCGNQPDGWHQYGPAVSDDSQAGYSYAISPGFWKANEISARLSRDLSRWARSVRSMVASGAPFQLVTTFNEWGEGTSVESAAQWASSSGYGSYLDVLHANGQAAGSPSPTAAPTPAPTPAPTSSPGTSVAVLVAAGDIAACGRDGDDATAALLDTIRGTVVTLGDNAYEEGTLQQYQDCYHPSWGRHRSRTMPVPGNHEYLTPNADGFRHYFAWGSRPTYYAFDAGEWRIYALDSNCSRVGGCGPSSPQYSWLAADLTANPRECVLAYWHHPKFTIGPHANDEGGSGVLWNLLHAHAVEVVLNGHDHNYQRWVPMRPDGTVDPNGIREFVNGAGGKNHTVASRSDGRVEAQNHDTYGVLKLTLRSGGYDWRFVPEAGMAYTDAGSGTCH